MAETRGVDIAGFLDNIELTCAHCQIEASLGGVFELWGSRTCPIGTQQMVAGVMVGSIEGYASSTPATTGGASNFLCAGAYGAMGLDVFNTAEQVGSSIGSIVYGADSTLSYVDGSAIACSTCLATGRSWNLMVSGRNDCPSSFTLEYSGHLLSSHHSTPPVRNPALTVSVTQKSEYVCVSSVGSSTTVSPSVTGGGGGDTDTGSVKAWLADRCPPARELLVRC